MQDGRSMRANRWPLLVLAFVLVGSRPAARAEEGAIDSELIRRLEQTEPTNLEEILVALDIPRSSPGKIAAFRTPRKFSLPNPYDDQTRARAWAGSLDD